MGNQRKIKLNRREERQRREAVQKTMREAASRLTPEERDACAVKVNELLVGIMGQVGPMLEELRQVIKHDEGAALAAAFLVIERASVETAVRCAHTLGQTAAGFLATCRDAYLAIELDPVAVPDGRAKPS